MARNLREETGHGKDSGAGTESEGATCGAEKGDNVKKRDPYRLIQVCAHDLKALIHWAIFGVNHSIGGTYMRDIENILECYGRHLGVSYKAEWGKYVKELRTPRKRRAAIKKGVAA